MKEFECSAQGLAEAKSYIRQGLEKTALSSRQITDFSMGLCELVMNMIDHGSPATNHFQVAITGDARQPKVNLFIDNAQLMESADFTRLLREHAEPPDPLDERGRGLSMVLHCLPGTRIRDGATGSGNQRCYTLQA